MVSVGRVYDANEDRVVYYDPASGDTHLLSDFAAYIVTQFSDRSMSTEELVKKIKPQTESADIDELEDAVLSVLNELVALDIVQQA